MSTGYDQLEKKKWKPLLRALGRTGPGWTLLIQAQEGEPTDTLRSVIAAARHRGLHVQHRPPRRDPDPRRPATAPHRGVWMLLLAPSTLVENDPPGTAPADPPPPERPAFPPSRPPDPGSPVHTATAADTLAHAVREILPMSAEAAVKLADRLLHLLDPDDPALATHLVTVTDAHLAAGRLTDAAALLRESLLRPLPEDVATDLRTRLTHVLLARGHAEAATIAAPAAADPATAATADPATVAAADPPDRHTPGSSHDEARAAYLFALSLVHPARTAPAADPPPRTGAAASVTALTAAETTWPTGDTERSRRLARQAVDAADTSASPVWRMLARLAYARKLLAAAQYTDAGAHIQQAADELTRPGLPTVYSPAPAIVQAELLTRTGSPRQALDLAERALRTACETNAALLIPLAHAALAEAALRLGDLDRSRWHATRAEKLLTPGSPRLWPVHHDWLQTRLAAELHGPRPAARLLTAGRPAPAAYWPLLLDEPGAALWLTRLGLAAGDGRLAEHALTAAEHLAQRNPRCHRLAVVARHARALYAADARDKDVSVLRWVAAQHPDRWDRAGALEDLGHRLATPPRPDLGEASRVLHAALCTFDQLGGVRDAERVRAHLRQLGLERVPPRQERTPWHDFSDTERLIAQLVSQGLTNHQIAGRISLSAHTVNYHLRKMFRKVSVNSRVELARLVNESTHATS